MVIVVIHSKQEVKRNMLVVWLCVFMSLFKGYVVSLNLPYSSSLAT